MNAHEAHDEGYDAYWDGIALEDNPFNSEDQAAEHEAWLDGWREARKHDYDESEGR